MSAPVKLSIDNFSSTLKSPQSEQGIVVVYFSASWCQPCRKMTPVFQQLADAFEKSGVVFAEVDAAQAPTIMQIYGIRSVPAVALFQHAQLLKLIAGEVSLDTLQKHLRHVIASSAV